MELSRQSHPEVKLDAFPCTKYGLLEGELVDLPDDAIEDGQYGLVYRVRVRLLEHKSESLNER